MSSTLSLKGPFAADLIDEICPVETTSAASEGGIMEGKSGPKGVGPSSEAGSSKKEAHASPSAGRALRTRTTRAGPPGVVIPK